MHIILDPHSAPPRPINARLDRHDGACHERTFRRFCQSRRFMHLESDSVPEAVSKEVTETAVLNVAPRHPVGIPTAHPGPYRSRRTLVRESHDVVDVELHRRRMAEEVRPGVIGVVPTTA